MQQKRRWKIEAETEAETEAVKCLQMISRLVYGQLINTRCGPFGMKTYDWKGHPATSDVHTHVSPLVSPPVSPQTWVVLY